MRDICSQARLTDHYFCESFRNTRDAYEAVCAWQKTCSWRTWLTR
jgi:hypothetical protein